MSTRHNDGSHYDGHRRAAELHDKAAHTHRVAAETRGQQDHETGHEQTRRALEHSHQAHLRSEMTRQIGEESQALGHDDISAIAHQLWIARGCPEGSPELDWALAREQLAKPKRKTAAA